MLNDYNVMGRITAEPKVENFDESVKVSFRIACDRDYHKKGEDRKTDFFPVVAWNLSDKFIKRFLKKGELIIIKGSMENNQYKADGGGVGYYTQIKADKIYPTNFKIKE